MLITTDSGIYKKTVTPGGTVITEYFGSGVKITPSMTNVNVLTGEVVTISFKWQTFNSEQGQYVDDHVNNTDIILDVTGTQATVTPVNGIAEITFTSAEPGEYMIRTINLGVGNAETKVIVSA